MNYNQKKLRSKKLRNSVFIRCYVCYYEWYYTGKSKRFANCPRCEKSIKISEWRLYEFMYRKDEAAYAIQKDFTGISTEDKLRYILFNIPEIKEKANSFWKW